MSVLLHVDSVMSRERFQQHSIKGSLNSAKSIKCARASPKPYCFEDHCLNARP